MDQIKTGMIILIHEKGVDHQEGGMNHVLFQR